jgi:hypothetical protein
MRAFRAEVGGDIRVLRTKLLGDDEGEDSQGRIPRIEAAQADLEDRVTALEEESNSKRWARRYLGWIASGLIVIAELIYHIKEIVRH